MVDEDFERRAEKARKRPARWLPKNLETGRDRASLQRTQGLEVEDSRFAA